MFRRLRKTRAVMVLVPAVLLLGASAASAGNVGVDVNLHIGNQPQQVIISAPAAPPPVVIREPAAPPPQVIVREPAPTAVITIDDDVDFV